MADKIPVMILDSAIAGGFGREAGKIYNLAQEDLAALSGRGKGRPATTEEIQAQGIASDPALAPGQGVVPASVRPEAAAEKAAWKQARRNKSSAPARAIAQPAPQAQAQPST